MSTVNTEGKLDWYLGIELSLRSIGAYLQLGFSLGAVQARHACVSYHLVVYQAKCLWRRKITHAPEDGILYLEGAELYNMGEEKPRPHGAAAHSTTISPAAATRRRPSYAVGGVVVTRPVCAPSDGPVDAHAFLAELLARFDSLTAITHGEAVDVRLLTRMMRQDILVANHRAAQAKAARMAHTSAPPSAPRASEENVVFRLSELDAAYGGLVSAGHAVAITYRDFVNLTTLLSEAIAWDLLWMHEALDQQRKKASAPASEDGRAAAATAHPPSPSSPVLYPVEADCVAVMLPNSVEYNAIWMAAARSGPLHTFLDVLYRNSNHINGSCSRGGTYRPCRTALLNTNLASNAMLYHAIECAGSIMLVVDPQFVPLLFCTGDPDEQGETQLELHVPPHVKRIYLWGSHAQDGTPLRKGMTEAMEEMLHAFNARAYERDSTAAVPDDDLPEPVRNASQMPPPPPPPLDLYDTIRDFYVRAQRCSSYTVQEPRHTYLISSPRARFLVQTILHQPPPGWEWLVALAPHSPATAHGAGEADAGGHLRHKVKHLPSAVQPTAANSAKGRQQLEQYKAKMSAILSALLQRFHHTQPVLFIYTSGTTGLPKAARFSHLRFFATGFLSRVLYYREHIAETVVQRHDEVQHMEARATPEKARTAGTRTPPPSSTRLAPVVSRGTIGNGNIATSGAHSKGTSSVSVAGISETDTGAGGGDDDARLNKDPPTAATRAEEEHQSLLSKEATAAAAPAEDHCPTIPNIFGVKALDTTRRQRTTVEATFVIVCNVIVWWVRYIASVFGWGYPVTEALERYWYTPEQRAAIEEERPLVTIYNCLPMYHTVGSVFCLGHLLHALEEQQYAWDELCHGTAAAVRLTQPVPSVRMILRTKFSASQFRRDLERYHVTVVQYIGEVLRYAVLHERRHAFGAAAAAAPSGAVPSQTTDLSSSLGVHKGEAAAKSTSTTLAEMNRNSWRVPYAFGNGLRQDIWLECMQRLNIAHPVEFYSSTEGNIFLLNLFGIPGVVGHIPRFPFPIQWLSMQYFPLFPFRVLKFNEETQEVYRDPASGYGAHCPVGEVGEVVGEVIDGFDLFALRRFDGYHKADTKPTAGPPTGAEEDTVARQSKVIRHVLWPYMNDQYFLSGDLVRMDRYGFCYFVDRVGDTFRWKGENVSTLEVSNALNSVHTVDVGVQEAVVYGVQLPGREGRAGMVLLSLQPSHARASPTPAGDDAAQNRPANTADNGTAATAAPPRHHRMVSLAEERRFLQEELYGFLKGTTQRCGDGTANQATLPPYAVPVFVRMQDPLEDEEVDEGHPPAHEPSTTAKVTEPTQTTTFKYKKGVLIKQGYAFDGSSTTAAEVPAPAWGTESTRDREGDTSNTTSFTRVYVLVTNPQIFKALAMPPAVRTSGEEEEGTRSSRSTAATVGGYVPLTPATLAVLGDTLDKCGW